jgi:hypothetical protein
MATVKWRLQKRCTRPPTDRPHGLKPVSGCSRCSIALSHKMALILIHIFLDFESFAEAWAAVQSPLKDASLKTQFSLARRPRECVDYADRSIEYDHIWRFTPKRQSRITSRYRRRELGPGSIPVSQPASDLGRSAIFFQTPRLCPSTSTPVA